MLDELSAYALAAGRERAVSSGPFSLPDPLTLFAPPLPPLSRRQLAGVLDELFAYDGPLGANVVRPAGSGPGGDLLSASAAAAAAAAAVIAAASAAAKVR